MTENNATMRRENVAAIFPLLPLQEALLFARDQAALDPGCLQMRCQLRGRLDLVAWKAALAATVQSHELLRASVKRRDAKPSLLMVWKEMDVAVHYRDLSEFKEDDRRSAIEQHVIDRREAGVDLSRPPCFQLDLLALDPQTHVWLWTFHHLLLDGWSTSMLVGEILERYANLVRPDIGIPSSLNQIAQYADFVNWYQGRPDSLPFWRDRLSGFSGTTPQFARKGFRQSSTQTQSSFALKKSNVEKVSDCLKRHGWTPSAVATAAWAMVLMQLYGQRDVVLGITVAGRSAPIANMQRLVGAFANVLPFRVNLEDGSTADVTVDEWLRSLRDAQFDMLPHEQVTLDEIEQGMVLQRSRVLLETLLVIENFPQVPNEDHPLRVEGYESGITSGFPLTACLLPHSWTVRLAYDPEECPDPLAQRLGPQFLAAIELLCDEGSADLTAFEIVDRLPPLGWETRSEANDPVPASHSSDVGELDISDEGGPINQTELELVMLWQRTLGRTGIRRDDNFFDLGGNSLSAMRLVAQMEDTLGRRYAPAIVVEYPTVAAMATLMERPDDAQPSFIRFNSVANGAPLVCVHAGGEQAMYFRFLASHFPDRPVIALQSPSSATVHAVGTIEKLAAFYRGLVDEHFPQSAAHFVGYCAGAPVALEMIHQYEAGGRSPASFSIVDSGIRFQRPELTLTRFTEKHQSIVKALPRLAFAFARRRYRDRPVWMRNLRRWFDTEVSLRHQRAIVESVTMNAYFSYSPATVGTPIMLVRSSHYAAMKQKDFHLSWQQQAMGRFETQVVTAIHERILLEPAVAEVAKKIRAFIEDSTES